MSTLGDAGAAATMRAAKTVTDLYMHYALATISGSPQVKILLVPGHEPDFGGTEYKDVSERDLVVAIGNYLQGYLAAERKFSVMTTRNKSAWEPVFSSYFNSQWDAIIAWRDFNKVETAKLVAVGNRIRNQVVYHTRAPEDTSIRLYGINKWSDENDIDIVIHLHINDYPRRNASTAGKYSGFAIYIPEKQYNNSPAARAVALAIYNRLSHFYPISDYGPETEGIVEDQDLIAVGVGNSASSASVLIEYGYIYEPQFNSPALQDAVARELAYETYLGIKDFFDASADVAVNTPHSPLLPYAWRNQFGPNTEPTLDAYALQTILLAEGLYPPAGKTKNDCPRSGIFGTCTKQALAAFQAIYNITGERAWVGEKTLAKLAEIY